MSPFSKRRIPHPSTDELGELAAHSILAEPDTELVKRTAKQLLQEVERLALLQQLGLQRATFTGMIPGEAKLLQTRQKRINTLINELLRLLNP